jgi:hypothetical protein
MDAQLETGLRIEKKPEPLPSKPGLVANSSDLMSNTWRQSDDELLRIIDATAIADWRRY